MKNALFAFALLMPLRALAEWVPPANPDPRAILDDAKADTDAGRYEDALAKHLWFHRHVLEHDRSYFGVRLSFALMAWHKLGKAYPPALEKLKEIRDGATNEIRKDNDKVWDAFIDMSSINEQLGDEDRTAAAFSRLHKESPDAARKVYDLAQPALVKTKEFTLCGKYLAPEKSYKRMIRSYQVSLDLAKEESAGHKRRLLKFAENHFLEESATLVALLVLNDRKPEAEKIAEDARGESKHRARDAIIDAALEGKLPKPQSE